MHFILFADDSLTVDYVTKVMEMVTDNKIKEVWDCLGVPDSLLKIITGNLLTEKQKTQACVALYLNYCPDMYRISWKVIAYTLYFFDEMAAAKEARTFLHKEGR